MKKAFILTLFFLISAPSWGMSPFKSFRLWTNDVSENIWGFESHCPKKLTPQRKTTFAAEEWAWLQEASKLHLKTLLRNHYHLGQMLVALHDPASLRGSSPHYPDEVTLIEENMVMIGQINRELDQLTNQPSYNSYCPISLKDCRDRLNRRQDKINQKIKLLTTARNELLLQTPMLAHHHFDYLINTVIRNDFPYQQNDPRFYDALEKTLRLNREIVEERIERLEMIITHEPYQMNKSDYDELLQDTALIEEIYISLRPTDKINSLYEAQCRIENRVLKNQATGELRTLALDAVFAMASLGFSSYISAGRVIVQGGLFVRAIPLILNETLSSVNDLNEIDITENRCQAILAALLHNRELAQDYIDCKRTKSDQITKALISATGSTLLIHRSLQTRLQRNIVRLFTIDLKTTINELKSMDLNAVKDLSYNIRDAVSNRKKNHPQSSTPKK